MRAEAQFEYFSYVEMTKKCKGGSLGAKFCHSTAEVNRLLVFANPYFETTVKKHK